MELSKLVRLVDRKVLKQYFLPLFWVL